MSSSPKNQEEANAATGASNPAVDENGTAFAKNDKSDSSTTAAAASTAAPVAAPAPSAAAAAKPDAPNDASMTTSAAPTIEQEVTNLDKARMRVRKAFARSKLLDPQQDHLFPRFEWSEIQTGPVLGVGGFGTVTEISKITLGKKKKGPDSSFSFRSWAELTGTTTNTTTTPQPQQQQEKKKLSSQKVHEEEDGSDSEDDSYYDECFQDKRFIAENTQRKGGDARYAIKFISPSVKKVEKLFLQAAMDMAVETQFLSVIQHEHVVRLRGVGQGDMFDKDYFLVMDRLYDTLEDRIDQWKAYQHKLKHQKGLMGVLRGNKKKSKRFLEERLEVARDLASAMEYLHSLNIIYRDFKPDNIGFDVRGVVKLFDFGLAKELHPDDVKPNGTYRLTGETGAVRYMAPEVATRRPYNLSADVYSFGIVLWECMALKVPFECYNSHMMKDMVANFGERPELNDKWSPELQNLISACWDANYRKRPDFTKVQQVLDKLVTDMQQEK